MAFVKLRKFHENNKAEAKYDENIAYAMFLFGCPAMVVSNYDLVKVSSHDMSSLVCESHACCVLLFEELDLEGDEIVVGTGNVDSLEK